MNSKGIESMRHIRTKRPVIQFGGDWTSHKLNLLKAYLTPYATIMKKQNFTFAYIDAFAGTGNRRIKKSETPTNPLFPDFAKKEVRDFLDGSARIALQIHPQFDKYIFIELTPTRFRELNALRNDFPELADKIELINADCNMWLKERCLRYNWAKHRAVLFLDPFGMQVEWTTIEAIAKTEAIDVLILFPLGVAVNRLLRKDGKIESEWRSALDRLFGTQNWYDLFYRKTIEQDLFETTTKMKKIVNLNSISRYYVERLKTVFPVGGVVERPHPLLNSKGNPLYHLCFAAGNPKGAKIAVKIANYVLKG
jgi:three-Cys-motif partner protein